MPRYALYDIANYPASPPLICEWSLHYRAIRKQEKMGMFLFIWENTGLSCLFKVVSHKLLV